MGYNVYIFKKEVKNKYPSDFSFMEKENLIEPFTDEQFEKLKSRLLHYGYMIENEIGNVIYFNFQGGKHGINAILSNNQLSFSSGFSKDGVFEISMTASELIDSGEFAKYDPQDGKWEDDW